MSKKSVLNDKGKGTGHRDVRPIWNNTQRINHQNKFVPTAVLTQVVEENILNTRISKGKVNIVRVKRVNTAEQTAVSTIKRKRVTAVKAFAGNQQQALKYKGMFDSRCSRHMTGNKALLTDYQDIDGGFFAFGGSTKGGKITSIGLKNNIDDGHTKEKNVSTQQYIMFLLWSSISSSYNSLDDKDGDDITFNAAGDKDVQEPARDPMSPVQTRGKIKKSSREHAMISYIQKKRRTNHKDFQNCLFACFLSQHEPTKISQALNDESWIEAMQEELLQFKIQKNKYVGEILKKYDLLSIRSASTPMETHKALTKDENGEDVDVHLYRSMIGSLMYLTSSRPDIMFSVYACSRFQVQPKVSHLYAVKRIFRYLKGRPKLGLWYPKDSPLILEAFLNSNYAGASLDRKSTTGGC
ncbi:hypothetical protein Tco_1378021 [Tanacetum coccineum]